MAATNEARLEYENRMLENELFFFNMPPKTTEQQLRDMITKAGINYKVMSIQF